MKIWEQFDQVTVRTGNLLVKQHQLCCVFELNDGWDICIGETYFGMFE